MAPKKKGPAGPVVVPVPRDLTVEPALDGVDGALGIEDVYVKARVRNVRAELVEWSLSEASRAGNALLELNDAGLNSLPSGLIELPWLHVLNLSRNYLTADVIPALAATLPNLRAVDLSGNLLACTLPAEMGALGGGEIEELFMDNNLIENLPAEAAKLACLTWLTMRKNQLTSIPGAVLGSWTKLIHLDLRNNNLKVLPAEIGACVCLEELYLTNNQLTELPDALGQCSSLLELHVASNNLSVMSPALAGCTALEVLDLSENKIAGALPGDIFPHLPSLLVLHISLNKITALPSELGCLLELEILNVASTAIKSIPDSLASCVHLREIYCNNTALTTLPGGITAWTELEAGVWRNCKLKALPPGVEDAWADKLTLLDVHAKGKKDTCKIVDTVRDKMPRSRIVGALWQKDKKKGKK